MAGLHIDRERCTLCGQCLSACPFGALERAGGHIEVSAACRLCKLCVKACPEQAITMAESTPAQSDNGAWSGVLVCGEMDGPAAAHITYELLGKALELAAPLGLPVWCALIGEGAQGAAAALLDYGLERILAYDDRCYRHFTAGLYAAALEDAINTLRPSVVLVGATAAGRSLAPRVATRFRTGLTADCTALKLREDGSLVQIRPAFGGNIMAQIVTPHTRPQFATVRYRVMDRARPRPGSGGIIEQRDPPLRQERGVRVLGAQRKPPVENISEAEVIVAAGRGLKSAGDLELLRALAERLGGRLACTRPLVEAGWLPYTCQIGLSGRTVKPRLIITCGISGAVQFTACMRDAELIIAVNADERAPIFQIAHVGVVGDLYEVVPRLAEALSVENGA